MRTARGGKRASAVLPPPEHSITHASLVEYLASGAVTELVVVEFTAGTYRLEASLSWRPGRSVLVAARGGERVFRSLDTVATFLRTIGIGATVLRLELKP